MISDTLSEAADEIENLLSTCPEVYGKSGDPLYDEIVELVVKMKRMRVKLDTSPGLEDSHKGN